MDVKIPTDLTGEGASGSLPARGSRDVISCLPPAALGCHFQKGAAEHRSWNMSSPQPLTAARPPPPASARPRLLPAPPPPRRSPAERRREGWSYLDPPGREAGDGREAATA